MSWSSYLRSVIATGESQGRKRAGLVVMVHGGPTDDLADVDGWRQAPGIASLMQDSGTPLSSLCNN